MVNPKKPKKLSVETLNGTSVTTGEAATSIPEFVVGFGVTGTTEEVSSIRNNEYIIIATQRENTIHFQTRFWKSPGSNIPRIRPMIGKI